VIYPTIHLNGTSRKDLQADNHRGIDTLRQAIRALEQTGPNGRDYYPQGPSAITQAIEEHEDRLSRLLAVYGELIELQEFLYREN
jgi:hypothetical protein